MPTAATTAANLSALHRAYAAARVSAKVSLPILSTLTPAEAASLRAARYITDGGSCGDLQITMLGMLAMEEPKAARAPAPKADREEYDVEAMFAAFE